jgi:hypothetical protein
MFWIKSILCDVLDKVNCMWYLITVDFNSWFDYVCHWYKAMEENKGYPIHVIHYEDITMVCFIIKNRILRWNCQKEEEKTLTEQ